MQAIECISLLQLSFEFQAAIMASYKDELNCCTILFELAGLQYFSLKLVTRENAKKKPSFKRKIHLTAILLFFMCGDFSVMGNNDRSATEQLNAKTVIMLLMQDSKIICLAAVVLTSIIQSYRSSIKLKKVFMNTQEITDILQNEFRIEIDFAKIRMKTIKKIVIMLSCMLLSYGVIAYFAMKSNTSTIQICRGIISYWFFVMTILKVNFFVRMTNDQLKRIEDLLRNAFATAHPVHSVQLITAVKSVKQGRINDELLRIRYLFNAISENTELINESLGWTLLLILTSIVIELTISGYQFVILAIGADSLEVLPGLR